MTSDSRDNCFDAIRLILALMVVYSHGVLLGGFGEEQFSIFCKRQSIAGSIAVLGFFGLSGFFITKSFIGGRCVRRFVIGRLLRILPGFYFTLLLTAFVFSPLIAHFNGNGGQWSLDAAFQYIIRNVFVRVGAWGVGGVTANLPYDESINGALWSLFPEICCYGGILLMGVTGTLRQRGINFLMLLGLFFSLHAATLLKPGDLLIAPTLLTLTHQSSYYLAFAIGAAAFIHREYLDFGGRPAIIWCLVVAILLKFGGWSLVGPIALPMALFHVGHVIRLKLPADYSYGIYLVHFPVMQTLSAFGLQNAGFLVYISIALMITFVFAAISWHFVEMPFLRFKDLKGSKISVA